MLTVRLSASPTLTAGYLAYDGSRRSEKVEGNEASSITYFPRIRKRKYQFEILNEYSKMKCGIQH